jgi:sugar O-acyltransferase (sialic acid O-acetyltransferase NeuD family)
MREIVLIGATNHAKMIIAVARQSGMDVRAVYDDDQSRHGQAILDVPISGPISDAKRAGLPCVLAIDDPRERQKLARQLIVSWATVVHPNAIVEIGAEIGPGCIVQEGVVIQSGVVVGRHVVISANSTISHDCRVGDFVQLGPAVSLAGGVQVAKGACLQIGAAVIPNVRVGAWADVGPRATVIRDVSNRGRVSGTPSIPNLIEPPPRAGLLSAMPSTLVCLTIAGALLTTSGYIIGRLGLFMRQVAVSEGVKMHPLALSLWFGVLLIALGVIVNLFVPYQNMYLARVSDDQATRARELSISSALSGALAILGIGMALYLLDCRYFF